MKLGMTKEELMAMSPFLKQAQITKVTPCEITEEEDIGWFTANVETERGDYLVAVNALPATSDQDPDDKFALTEMTKRMNWRKKYYRGPGHFQDLVASGEDYLILAWVERTKTDRDTILKAVLDWVFAQPALNEELLEDKHRDLVEEGYRELINSRGYGGENWADVRSDVEKLRQYRHDENARLVRTFSHGVLDLNDTVYLKDGELYFVYNYHNGTDLYGTEAVELASEDELIAYLSKYRPKFTPDQLHTLKFVLLTRNKQKVLSFLA